MSPTFQSQEDDIGNKKSRWRRGQMMVEESTGERPCGQHGVCIAVAAGTCAAIVRPNGGRTMMEESTGEGSKAVSITWRALRAGLGEREMEMMGHGRQDRGERDKGRAKLAANDIGGIGGMIPRESAKWTRRG